MKALCEFNLIFGEVLCSGDRSPRRGAVPTPLKLIVFGCVALRTVLGRQFRGNREASMIHAHLPIAWLMTVQAGDPAIRVHARFILVDHRGSLLPVALRALAGRAYERGRRMRQIDPRPLAVYQECRNNEGSADEHSNKHGLEFHESSLPHQLISNSTSS
jgi:hypothetical protein